MIDRTWLTERLLVRDAIAEDLPSLERVLESNREILRLEGILYPDPDELRRWLEHGYLPPNGLKKRYRLQSILCKESGEVIGYMGLYHGYPDAKTLYIGSLSLRQNCHNNGYGGELVNQMPFLTGLKGFPTHRLVVTVRNWRAVRFWIRHGFTTIQSVTGNLHEGDGPTARLELTRNLTNQ